MTLSENGTETGSDPDAASPPPPRRRSFWRIPIIERKAAGEDVASSDEVTLVAEIPALADAVTALVGEDDRPAVVASAVEFVLEGLHLSKRLNKDADHRGTRG